MITLNMTLAIGIIMAFIIAAGVASPASAALERLGKFAPPNWPEETTHPPECRIVQADGTPCRRVERDW